MRVPALQINREMQLCQVIGDYPDAELQGQGHAPSEPQYQWSGFSDVSGFMHPVWEGKHERLPHSHPLLS